VAAYDDKMLVWDLETDRELRTLTAHSGYVAQMRLRVVAADPPIDWKKVRNQTEYINVRNDRRLSITSVIASEVLAKKHKALLLFGESHLFHKGTSSSVADYEKTYPGVTFVVFTHKGFGSGNPLDVHNDKLEARMKSWPVPSIVPVRGVWLADLDMAYYFEFIAKSIVGLAASRHPAYAASKGRRGGLGLKMA
jgi:hypothetical protein